MDDEPGIDIPGRLGLYQRLRFLVGDVVLYGGATAMSAAVGLVSFPVLARHFATQEFGLIDLFSVLATLATTMLVFGQDSAVARFFYEYSDTSNRKQVASQALAVQVALLLVFIPLMWLFAGRMAAALSNAGDAQLLLRLVILQVPFLLLINFSQNILKWTFARREFLVISIGSSLLSVSALLVGVLILKIDVVGVFVVFLATRAIFAGLGVWFVRRWLVVPSDWGLAREMLPFALPLALIASVSVLVPLVERALVLGLVGDRDLGIYAAGARVAMLIGLPVSAFQIAWGPFSLAIHKEVHAEHTYNSVLKAFTFIILTSVLALAAVAEPAIRLLASERYSGAAVVVFPIAMGLAVEGIGWITAIGIGISKRSYLSLFGYAVYAVVAGLAIYLLVQPFGLIGAAWGLFLAHAGKSVVETFLAQRAYPCDWAFGAVLAACTVVAGIGLSMQFIVPRFGHGVMAMVDLLCVTVIPYIGARLMFSAAERLQMAELLLWRPRSEP